MDLVALFSAIASIFMGPVGGFDCGADCKFIRLTESPSRLCRDGAYRCRLLSGECSARCFYFFGPATQLSTFSAGLVCLGLLLTVYS